jgi:YidC/Oxa1 family membrane protein insertase
MSARQQVLRLDGQKVVQPEMMAIRERYGDDKAKQQQALMDPSQEEQFWNKFLDSVTLLR